MTGSNAAPRLVTEEVQEMQGEGKSASTVAACVALAATLVALALASSALAVTSVPFTRALTDTNAPPGIQVGKIDMQWPDGANSDCSASVVDAPNRSTLITAAHCIYTSRHLGKAVSVRFAPGYNNGNSPYDQYFSREIAIPQQWIAGSSQYDYAFIVVGRTRKGRAVQDLVGAIPIAFNQPRNQPYRLIGYPNSPDPPFNGATSWTCSSGPGVDSFAPAPRQNEPPTIVAGCDMGDGASGGPWLTDQGIVASVTHTTFPSTPNVLGGPFLDDAAAALFDSVKNISTVRKKCRKKKQGKKSAAVAKKMKCRKKKGKK